MNTAVNRLIDMCSRFFIISPPDPMIASTTGT